MPTFAYHCLVCDHRFDVLLLPREKDMEVSCPACTSTDVQRGITAASVLYKGSGYYSTDSGSTPSAEKPPSTPPSTESTSCTSGCSCH